MKILENQTENTDGSETIFTVKENSDIAVSCTGTFNGATVTLQSRLDGGEWVACGEHTTFILAGMGMLTGRSGMELRGVVTNAGASTNLTLSVV